MKSLQKISPAMALFMIAPIFGELFSGSSPLNEFINPLTFLTLALLYGCGAILCRELVMRWCKGWFSLFLLGLAYGIYEEGLLVQSFFDPAWMDLGSLAVYGRVAGVNWVWAEHLTIFHALISITASVAFVEMLYPARRQESWLGSRFWWGANLAGFLGVYALWEIMTTYDPGVWKWLSWLVVLGLVLSARLLPVPQIHPQLTGRQPARPRRFWLSGFLGMFVQFFIVYNGADSGAYPFPVTMLLLLVFDLLIYVLLRRWSGKFSAWDDRHKMALIIGVLSFFLVMAPLTVGSQYPVMYYSHPLYLLLLWLAYRRVNRRFAKPAPQEFGSPAQPL